MYGEIMYSGPVAHQLAMRGFKAGILHQNQKKMGENQAKSGTIKSETYYSFQKRMTSKRHGIHQESMAATIKIGVTASLVGIDVIVSISPPTRNMEIQMNMIPYGIHSIYWYFQEYDPFGFWISPISGQTKTDHAGTFKGSGPNGWPFYSCASAQGHRQLWDATGAGFPTPFLNPSGSLRVRVKVVQALHDCMLTNLHSQLHLTYLTSHFAHGVITQNVKEDRLHLG